MPDLARQDILCATLAPTRGEATEETVVQPGISLVQIASLRTRWEDVPQALGGGAPVYLKHRQRYVEVWRVDRDLGHFRALTGPAEPLFLPFAIARAGVVSALQQAGLAPTGDGGVLGCTLSLQEMLDATGTVKVLPLDVLLPHVARASWTLRWEGWIDDQRPPLGDLIRDWPSAIMSHPPTAS